VDFIPLRSKNDWKSWCIVSWAVVLLFCVFDLASRAIRENDAASTQQTSFGTITDCERSGRSGYSCNYVFPVEGEQYTGDSRSDSYRTFGQTVVVYYDSQAPTTSALEDFSGKARKDWNFVYIFLLMIAALVAFVLYSKATDRKDSKQRTT
jgi:hypothetical protein